ncbi:hypothetical protein KKB68_00370 [Patescibacteria group bacterium]|nr:hypothetical protein [Patescibacteria group bacterium]
MINFIDQITLFFDNTFNIFLVLFLIILGFYLWNAFCIIYHLLRFGIGVTPKILALIFFAGSILLFSIVITSYAQVDWQDILSQLPDFSKIITY